MKPCLQIVSRYTVKTILVISFFFTSISLISGSTPAAPLIFLKPNTHSLDKENKIRPELLQNYEEFKARSLTQASLGKDSINNSHQFVLIDAIAKEDPNVLLKDLTVLGLQSSAINGRIISGLLPLNSLDKLNTLQSLNEISSSRIITNQGSVTSNGDRAQQSNFARQNYVVDGKGVTIGVMSDSYNCLGGVTKDKLSKDLPEQAISAEDAIICTGKTDEGRALMQILHDIAPGAQLIFHSSANGLANSANAILELAFEHNVDIIIDDTKSLSANFFQKDAISQAVDRVVRAGVVYVTAAGNSGRNSYQSPYSEYINAAFQLNAHDFDPGPAVDIYQRIEVPEGAGFMLLFQWDSPAYSISGPPGTQSDLDIFIFNQTHTKILASSTYGNIGRDPVEILTFFNPTGSSETHFNLMITKASGISPGLMKYIILNSFDGIIQEFVTGSSGLFRHANLESALTVGAANYIETPAFGTTPPLLQSYSSAGGTPFLLDLKGSVRLNPSTPKKPDIVAPDNVNTTFFGIDSDDDGNPNISGTSAAAPHAAGVVALLLESNPALQPVDIKQILQSTSIDIIQRNDEAKTSIGAGFDLDSGYGLIDAEAAVNLSKNYQASTPAEPAIGDSDYINVNDPSQVGGGGVLGMFSILIILITLLVSVRTHTEK